MAGSTHTAPPGLGQGPRLPRPELGEKGWRQPPPRAAEPGNAELRDEGRGGRRARSEARPMRRCRPGLTPGVPQGRDSWPAHLWGALPGDGDAHCGQHQGLSQPGRVLCGKLRAGGQKGATRQGEGQERRADEPELLWTRTVARPSPGSRSKTEAAGRSSGPVLPGNTQAASAGSPVLAKGYKHATRCIRDR